MKYNTQLDRRYFSTMRSRSSLFMTLRWICDVVVAAVSCYRHQEVYVYNLINSIAAAEAAAMAVVLVVL